MLRDSSAAARTAPMTNQGGCLSPNRWKVANALFAWCNFNPSSSTRAGSGSHGLA